MADGHRASSGAARAALPRLLRAPCLCWIFDFNSSAICAKLRFAGASVLDTATSLDSSVPRPPAGHVVELCQLCGLPSDVAARCAKCQDELSSVDHSPVDDLLKIPLLRGVSSSSKITRFTPVANHLNHWPFLHSRQDPACLSSEPQ